MEADFDGNFCGDVCGGLGGFTGGRNRRDEYYAGFSDGADAGDWCTQSDWCAAAGYSLAIFTRGDDAFGDWRGTRSARGRALRARSSAKRSVAADDGLVVLGANRPNGFRSDWHWIWR